MKGVGRSESLSALTAREHDLLVIGGGIVGAGVARDAALRGLKVALVDRGDFAQGTSSRSSKMVHGGLRYLEQYAFGLVHEACSERRILQRIAPHLVHPQAFVVPAFRGSKPSRAKVELGMWAYDAMALFRNTQFHKPLGAKRLGAMEPGLRGDRLAGGSLFFDCLTDDARLTLENILDAEAHGAVALNYAQVTALHVAGGRIKGADVQDLAAGDALEVRAKAVVNASGPWSDEISKMADPNAALRVRMTRGAHIVVPRSRLGHERAFALRAPQDRRVFFVVPWGNLSLVGTTDTDYAGDPGAVRAEADDVRYLLAAANHYFPAANLTKEDVVGAYAGLRPLIRQPGVSPSAASREHALFTGPSGFVTVVGGKLTTYRRMAREIVDAVAASAGLEVGPSRSGREPLPGGKEPRTAQSAAARALAEETGLPLADAETLRGMYGSRAEAVLAASEGLKRGRLEPSLPYLEASVRWAFDAEHANLLEDALVRRVPISVRARDGGASVAEKAAALAAGPAGWDSAEQAHQVERYLKRVERESAWRRAL